MSVSKKMKGIIVFLMVLLITISLLGLVGCGPETTELVYELNDEGTGYLVDTEGNFVATEIVIPATYDGMPVVGIKEKAFRKCKNLEKVVIQYADGNNEDFIIGPSAFKKCKSLQSVLIERTGSIKVSDSAFSDCENLTTFKIASAEDVKLGTYSFEYIKNLTVSINDASIQINSNAFFAGDEDCSFSLELTGCQGSIVGSFENLKLVNCSFNQVVCDANNLVLDNTKLLDDELFFSAQNATFRGTVVYHNNYKETWLTKKGGLVQNLTIESIGEGSEFSQCSADEYYPLAPNITIGSVVTSLPSGITGNGSLADLEYWKGETSLTITYEGARTAFEQMPYDTLYNGNLLSGNYTLKSTDGQPAKITFIDKDGKTVATVNTTVGATLDYDTYAPMNTTLVAGEMINGYFTDAEHTKGWVIDAPILGDLTVYVSYVDRTYLQKAELERTSNGLAFIKKDSTTFSCDYSKNNTITLEQIKASFKANEYASIAFFGNAEGTTPAPTQINEIGMHYVYAHVTSWDKTVTNVYVLEIDIRDIFEVKFISDGQLWNTRTCTDGYTLSFPNNPTKKGHTFLGWSKDATESQIISRDNYKPTENHTLTAVFRQDIYTVKIEGTSLEYQVVYGQSLTLPLPENRTYYEFKGYEYNNQLITDSVGESGCTIGRYPLECGVTLKPKYEPIRYSIVLLGEGVNQTLYYTVEDSDVVLPAIKRDWYTFVGWFTEENGGGTQLTKIESSAPDAYTLYAHFELATYTVRFMDGDEVISTQTFHYNNQLIAPVGAPQKDGYTSTWESYTLEPRNFDVQLVRTPIVYNITYENTFGLSHKNPVTYTVEDAIVLGDLAREHYEFLGWVDENGQRVTSIAKGTLGDMTLTAQWAVAKYTVHLVLGENSEATHKVEYNTQFDLNAAEIPTAPDKLFVGWYNRDYTEQLSGKITVTGEVFIYAKWLESIAISSVEDFEKIRENPSGTFHLTCDVDMRSEIITPIDTFSGVLDGMGYRMYNFALKINATLSSFGLFNVNEGTIRALTLDEVICSVTADGTEACIGILVGTNKGTVSNCHVISPSLTVNSSRHVGVGFQDGTTVYPFHIGGLVGKNNASVVGCSASIVLTARFEPGVSAPGHWQWNHEMRPYIGGLVGSNNGTITSSHASSSINCTGLGNESGNSTCARNCFYIGGLVGINNQGFTVEKCFANTDITASTTYRSDQWTEGKIYIGAFVGRNEGIIKENYATGTIDAYAFTEGYVGGFSGTDSSSSHISNCYTTATITSTQATNVGGFIGALAGTVQNCYATGAVSVESGANVAGFVGIITNSGVANKCFTTSSISTSASAAGFFSASTSGGTGIITNCYYSAIATVIQKGESLIRAEENGARRDYLSSITDPAFLKEKMYFYPEFWIYTTGAPILKWEIETDASDLTNGSHYVCTSCGSEFTSNTAGAQTIYFDKAASCDTDGFRYFGCSHCNKFFAVTTQKATGHSYSNDAEGKDFCNHDILVTYTCTNSGCSHTYTEQLTATGHRHNHTDSCLDCGYTYLAPDCFTDGYVRFVCDDCGNEITKPLAAEHLWEFAAWITEPDCELDGFGKFTCTRCLANGTSSVKEDFVQNSRLGHMDLNGDGICDRDGCENAIYDATDAIEISTLEQLLAIGKDVSNGSLTKTYILTADIDLKDVSWEPIGSADNPFTGVFLGGGFKIKNVPLFANDATLGYCGLFGYNSGLISDLTVVYDNYSALATNRSVTYGGIAAFNDGTINKCTVSGTVALSFLSKAEVNTPGASASAMQNVKLGLVAGVNNGHIIGCLISASYTFTFETYAFTGEEIDHVEAGLLTSGNYKNMNVKATQSVFAGAVCGINNMNVSNCTVSGAGAVYNYLALSQFVDGRWGFLSASSTQSFGTIAGNENLLGLQSNTSTGTLTYSNTAGTHTPANGNDPGNNYYGMSSSTTVTIYN